MIKKTVLFFVTALLFGCGKNRAQISRSSFLGTQSEEEKSKNYVLTINVQPGHKRFEDPLSVQTIIYYANGVAYPVVMEIGYESSGIYKAKLLRGALPYQLEGQNVCMYHTQDQIIQDETKIKVWSYNANISSETREKLSCGIANIAEYLYLPPYKAVDLADKAEKSQRALNILDRSLSTEQIKNVFGSYLIKGSVLVKKTVETPKHSNKKSNECFFRYGYIESRELEEHFLESQNRTIAVWKYNTTPLETVTLTCSDYEKDKVTCENVSSQSYPFNLFYQTGMAPNAHSMGKEFHFEPQGQDLGLTSGREVCLHLLKKYFYHGHGNQYHGNRGHEEEIEVEEPL